MSGGNYYPGWAYGGTIDQFGGVSQQQSAYPYASSTYNAQPFGPYGQVLNSSKNNQGAHNSTPAALPSGTADSHQWNKSKPDNKLSEGPWKPMVAGNANSVSNLDAAVFTAAKNYLTEQRTQTGQKLYGTWRERFRGGKGPPIDPSQWKYCELCKCTCAGDQAYKAHIVGKAHKKKEQTEKMGGGAQSGHLYCELCEVSCSSNDAYAAHVRGVRHQKILKVQMRMGKPVPDHLKTAEAAVAQLGGSGMSGMPSGNHGKKIVRTTSQGGTKIITTPRITFIGGKQLHSTDGDFDEGGEQKVISYGGRVGRVEEAEEFDEDAQTIGEIYMVETFNETGSAVHYYCKLCDCSFTDKYAKLCHAKGRRHKLQYKKKVDPSLKVTNPTSGKFNHGQPWRRKDMSENLKAEAESLRYEKEMLEWQIMKSSGHDSYMGVSMYKNCSDNLGSSSCNADNQHISVKHTEIYPSEEDLGNVRDVVLAIEKALKALSDNSAAEGKERSLKGVMRVKNLANGLLLKNDLVMDFVVLTTTRPTKTLLISIAKDLPKELASFREDKWVVEIKGELLKLKSDKFDNIMCNIQLTSPSMAPPQDGLEGSEVVEVAETKDHLSKEGCLAALALLRQAKWFQVKLSQNVPNMTVLRVIMDFCKRVPTWTPLGQWALELLVEKVTSVEGQSSPAVAMRMIFEAVASGVLMEGNPGLLDPCEKQPTDAAGHLSAQEREDITNSAQHALRMFSFGLLYRILGLPKKLPPPSLVPNMSKKRPRVE